MRPKIRVLIVDDSALVRKLLSEAISMESDMEVVGTAPDPYIARDKILTLSPDVMTLDIEMPRMDGLTFLKKLMIYHPLPVVIVSSVSTASCSTALEALQCGAVEVLAKPAGPFSVGDLGRELAGKVRAAAASRVTPVLNVTPVVTSSKPSLSRIDSGAKRTSGVIAVGASTGGTRALQDILVQLPIETPGIVVTQHIPAGFSLTFANRLNSLSAMEVKEAMEGDEVRSGRVLIAPGGFHPLLRRNNQRIFVQLCKGLPVCYQRPSFDVMFASVAKAVGRHALGVLLTGMGTDGAKGLLALKNAGAETVAQDENSCVVYGMPREAVRLNAARKVAPLCDIPHILDGFSSGGHDLGISIGQHR